MCKPVNIYTLHICTIHLVFRCAVINLPSDKSWVSINHVLTYWEAPQWISDCAVMNLWSSFPGDTILQICSVVVQPPKMFQYSYMYPVISNPSGTTNVSKHESGLMTLKKMVLIVGCVQVSPPSGRLPVSY